MAPFYFGWGACGRRAPKFLLYHSSAILSSIFSKNFAQILSRNFVYFAQFTILKNFDIINNVKRKEKNRLRATKNFKKIKNFS
jgi:hypothetical protein